MKTKTLAFSVTIKDCQVETFTVGGPGGGGKDTSNTGVRVRHLPSGAGGEGREERSQVQNKRAAFTRMGKTKLFRRWAQEKVRLLAGGKPIAKMVEEWTAPAFVKEEVLTDRGWRPISEAD